MELCYSFLNPSFQCNLAVVHEYIHIYQNNNIYLEHVNVLEVLMLEDSISATKCNWMHSNAVLGYCFKLNCLCWSFISINAYEWCIDICEPGGLNRGWEVFVCFLWQKFKIHYFYFPSLFPLQQSRLKANIQGTLLKYQECWISLLKPELNSCQW